MKTMFVAAAALMMLAACDAPKAGCAECEKMARDAKVAHEAKMGGMMKDCECCKGKKHAH